MSTDTYDGNNFDVSINESDDSLFSTASFEPEAIEILTPDDVYGATADILEKEFKSIEEVKEFINDGLSATKAAFIFRGIFSGANSVFESCLRMANITTSTADTHVESICR